MQEMKAGVLPAALRADRSSKLSKVDVFCWSYSRNTFCLTKHNEQEFGFNENKKQQL